MGKKSLQVKCKFCSILSLNLKWDYLTHKATRIKRRHTISNDRRAFAIKTYSDITLEKVFLSLSRLLCPDGHPENNRYLYEAFTISIIVGDLGVKYYRKKIENQYKLVYYCTYSVLVNRRKHARHLI